jgi:energy-coupling factor transport system ATP-binding protein
VAQDADLFIADEPTAHLAPEAAERFHRLVAEPRPGQTILVVDHRFDGLIEHIDRIVALAPDGAILADGPPRCMLRQDHARLRAHGVWTPAASALDARLTHAGCASAAPPLSVAEALASLSSENSAARSAVAAFVTENGPPFGPGRDQDHTSSPVARLDRAACAPFLSKPVLSEISLALYAGEIAALVGPNGAGKTTLGATLAGVLPLKAGRREGPPGGIAFQKAESQFLTGRVRDELAASLPKRMPAAETTARVSEALERWTLGGFEERHPYELSEGQKRRLSLASLTMTDRWPLIVLDEPTAGLDAAGADNLAGHIAVMRDAGKAVLLITHDLDFAARLADRLIVLAGGRVLADGDPGELFADDALLQRAGLKPPACVAAARWLAEQGSAC